MKILKPGKLPEDHNNYRGTCSLCGCVVQCLKEELKSGYSGTDSEYGYYVMCPTKGCERQIDMTRIVTRGS